MEKSRSNKKLLTAILTIGAFLVGILFGKEAFVEKYVAPHIPEIVEEGLNQQQDLQEERAAQELYSVTRIADGDTFTIRKNGEDLTLRLLGIDTPEKRSSFTEEECYGKEATKIITEILEGQDVRYELDKLSGEFDRYERTLAYVYTEDGTFINAELLKRGAAKMYEKNTTHELYEVLKSLEVSAQKAGVGLWSVCKV